jgi:hypothetical protein
MGLSTDLDRAPRVHASMPGLDFAISPSKGTGKSTAPINVARNWDFTLPILDTLQKIKFFAG